MEVHQKIISAWNSKFSNANLKKLRLYFGAKPFFASLYVTKNMGFLNSNAITEIFFCV